MRIRMAHIREQGFNVAVFGADAVGHTNADRSALLTRLVAAARTSGLRVDKAALQYAVGGQIHFFGAPDCVRWLRSIGGIRRWTHELSV